MGMGKEFRGRLQNGYMQRITSEGEATREALQWSPGVDFHIQCMRVTVTFADRIKVAGNVCEGMSEILERKKSAEELR